MEGKNGKKESQVLMRNICTQKPRPWEMTSMCCKQQLYFYIGRVSQEAIAGDWQ